jgi:hypothetical protein
MNKAINCVIRGFHGGGTEVEVFWVTGSCSLEDGEIISEAVLPLSSGLNFVIKEKHPLDFCLTREVPDA